MAPLLDRLRSQADTFRDTRCELLHEGADRIEQLEIAEFREQTDGESQDG